MPMVSAKQRTQNDDGEFSDEQTDDYEAVLNQLADRVNSLNDRLTTSNVESIIDDSRQKLDQWRVDCYQLIDRFYERKCREFDRHVADVLDKQRKEINRIRSTLAVLIHKQDLLARDIQSVQTMTGQVEEDINDLKEKYLRLDIHAVQIHDNLIQIHDYTHSPPPSILSPPYRTINYLDDSSKILSANDRHLLIHQNSKICLLDKELNLVREKSWINGWIMDICWSSILARFLVLTRNALFLIDESTMSIVRVQKLAKLTWWSCTCSDTYLYVSTKDWGCDVHQLSLWPAIQLVKRWQAPETCDDDQTINNLIYHKENLAMMVYRRATKAKSIELRRSTTFERLWSIDLDIDYDSRAIRCCLLHTDEWLVVDWNTSNLFHLSSDGKLKLKSTYHPSPSCATMFGANLLAISTADGINLHKL